MEPILCNLLVAASNLFALPTVIAMLDHPLQMLLVNLVMTASTLMHLSERKHGLPGIYPFNEYSRFFLWCDRLLAYAAVAFFLSLVYQHWASSYVKWVTAYAIVGLAFGLYSETLAGNNHLLFCITHIAWHFIAYTGLLIIWCIHESK